ncbi:hypothetical protein HKCCE4037_04550 [Rhodobacterales bacterium HKCCE4037]|nr:hypothetical protein [Rhodobacterales bacterium HKCCE4037]
MTRMTVFSLAFVIAGCVQAQEAEDECGAAGLQGLVGQTAAIAELLEFPGQVVRIVGPGDAVTMDYRSDRLNILIEDGLIESISCG